MNRYLVNLCDEDGELLSHPRDKLIVHAESEDDVETKVREHGHDFGFFISDLGDFEYRGWKERGIKEIGITCPPEVKALVEAYEAATGPRAHMIGCQSSGVECVNVAKALAAVKVLYSLGGI